MDYIVLGLVMYIAMMLTYVTLQVEKVQEILEDNPHIKDYVVEIEGEK